MLREPFAHLRVLVSCVNPYPEDKTYLQGVEQRNLIVHHAPAGAAASWYFPGHTLLIVITRPGVEVVWPTDREMAENAKLAGHR